MGATAIYPLTDLELARRLERTEAVANASFVEARARVEPDIGAEWTEVAGVYAMFDGIDSPITQTFGLGLFDTIGEAEIATMERFFTERRAPVYHEVSPLIQDDVLALLNSRGYHPIEFSAVMIRPVALEVPASGSEISVKRVSETDVPTWALTAADGWSTEAPGLAGVIEQFGNVIGRARDAYCFLAYRDGRPIAAAALCLNSGTALLAGASTTPGSRRLGAQRALLQARLQFAAEHGAELAMMVARPGSASQRNAERQGFRTVYTRSKFQLGVDIE